MHQRRPTGLIASLLVALTLTACSGNSGSPGAIGTKVVQGIVSNHAQAVPFVGFIFSDETVVSTAGDAVKPEFVYQPDAEPGLYLGALSPVNPSTGAFTMTLPAAADLPSSAFRNATSFIVNVDDDDNCVISATNPSAKVLIHNFYPFGNFSVPGIFALTLDQGGVFSYVSDVPFLSFKGLGPEAAVAQRFITWVYAKEAVDITGSCSGPLFVTSSMNPQGTPEPPYLDIDLSLVVGWNQIAWVVSSDATAAASIANDASSPVFVTPLYFDPEPCTVATPTVC